MAAMTFDLLAKIPKLLRVLDPNTDPPGRGRARVKPVLDALVSMGFVSARFYDIAPNIPTRDRLLILSLTSGMPNENELIGHKIPYKDSTQGRSDDQLFPTVDCGYEGEKSQGELIWINRLGLSKQCWVDIPLWVGKDLIGLIGCAWEGSKTDLSKGDLTILQLIGSRVAHFLLPDSHVLEISRNRLSSVLSKSDSVSDILHEGCAEICRIIGCPVGAIFKYKWITHELIKIFEYIDPSLEKQARPFEEIRPCGEHLTGQAWSDKSLWHIVDFESLYTLAPSRVDTASYDRHTSLLGRISSVLYSNLGQHEQEYQIRLMNRSLDHRLHLVTRHRLMFDSLCSELSAAIDAATSHRRLKYIEAVAGCVVEQIGFSDEIWSRITDGLIDEGVENCGVLCHSKKGGTYFSHSRFQGPVFAGWSVSSPHLWREDPFYSLASQHKEAYVSNVLDIVSQHKDNQLLKQLAAKGVEQILVFPFHLVKTQGIFFLPLPKSPSRGTRISMGRLRKDSPVRLGLFSTLVDIIGSCIEAEESHMTAESALNIIGHIGHEAYTPSVILAQSAIKTVYTAMNCLSPSETDALMQMRQSKQKIENEMRHLNATFAIARMIAEENRGQLQFHFREANLFDLLISVKEALREEMSFVDQNSVKRDYKIIFRQSCQRLPTLVCDPDMIHQVFINLIRNAMKFSLPPGQLLKPMEIILEGNPQVNMAIVRVINWGLGILEEDYERIFQRFYRADVVDRKKSIRGMGLGLYICRRIVSAHNGMVFCVGSKPTFSDVTRRLENPLEGFQTTFEVRLGLGLKLGVRVITWDERNE